MPLLDHFRPPLSERQPWESFHSTWCGALADHLNRDVLPAGGIALEQVTPDASIEIDVATYAEEDQQAQAGSGGGTATLPRTVWLPATPPVVLPVEFPDRFTVEIHSTEGERTLVGAIELVSPANKDRPAKRRLFAAKCAAYLGRGVGLVLVDVVTTRHGNLHAELQQTLGITEAAPFTTPLYATAYRALRKGDSDHMATWLIPLAVGQKLPDMPLSLAADFCVRVNREAAYQDACSRRRFDDVLI